MKKSNVDDDIGLLDPICSL